MMLNRANVVPVIALIVAAPLLASRMQQMPAVGEWTSYHGSLTGARYSPLDQINAANAGRLRTAWTWTAETASVAREARSQNTPLMVGGTLYFTAGSNRAVIAADPATGKVKWVWSMDESDRRRVVPRQNSGRGVAFWNNPAAGSDRIFTVTPGFQLVALDAATGTPISTFGESGVVDLKQQLGVQLHVDSASIGSSSPPLVFENIVVIGPALQLGTAPPSMRNVPGRILALDAVSGKLLWRFNTIPQAGEFGVETWENESWSYTGNAGAWAPLSLDESRGYLYLPVEAATGDYYGGHRHGDNLFSSSIVCLDVRTGKRLWHFQTVHHDIWDYDNPTTPILVDITVNGRRIEALAQITKQSFTYVLDRVTGEPVWPIEERPVPQSDVPGEKTAPTQPFPTKPPPFDRQGVTVDDLIDFTPELRAQAIEAIKPFRLGRLFSPPSLAAADDGTRGTLSLPNSLGGANWEHGAFDPETGMLYVGSWTSATVLSLRPGGQRSDMTMIGALGSAPNIQGLPLVKPPYSRITAIDLNAGEIRWLVAAGETPDRIRNNPALAGMDIPRTGSTSRPVVLATKTLLFQGEGPSGGSKLHVLNKATGAIVRDIELGAPVTSSPMTYLHQGRQYVLVWTSDTQARTARLVALSLDSAGVAAATGRPEKPGRPR
jgi:quinoprotein glucose dehydrogenase